MTQLPRAMLIDMDDTILSAYGRPEIAWNIVATEFADETGAACSPRRSRDTITGRSPQVLVDHQDRCGGCDCTRPGRISVKNGFAALAASGKYRYIQLAIRLR